MDFLVIIAVIIAGAFIFGYLKVKKDSEGRASIQQSLESINNFSVDHVLLTPVKGIALDVSRKQLGLALLHHGLFQKKAIPAALLNSVDVECVDGVASTTKGLLSPAVTKKFLHSINLLVSTGDTEYPVIRVPLYSFDGNKNDLSLRLQNSALELGNTWRSLISSLIVESTGPSDHAKRLDGIEDSNQDRMHFSDRLSALAELRRNGDLSEEEFGLLKKKILSEV